MNMKRMAAWLLIFAMLTGMSGVAETTPSEPEITPEVTPAPTATQEAEATPIATQELEVTPTPTAAQELEVTPTPSATQEIEVTPTPTAAQELEVTPTPSATQEAEATPIATQELEVTPTPSAAQEVEVTPTPTAAQEIEVTPTPIATQELEVTPTPSATQELEVTPTPTATQEAEATPTPSATQEAEATPTPSATQEIEVTPTPSATQEIETTPTPSATQELEVTPTPSATQEPVWTPQGQAWAKLADGTPVDGALQDVIAQLALSGETPTVYLMTEEKLTLSGEAAALLEQLTLRPDPQTFSDSRFTYAVRTETGEAAQGEIPPVTVWVEKAEKATAEPTTAPETTATPEPTAAPETTATPEPTAAPETTATPEPTAAPEVTATPEPTAAPEATATPEPTAAPEVTVTPEPTATPEPASLRISVQAQNYRPGVWSNVMPVFTLSGIEEGDKAHMYGVFVMDERLVLLSDGNNAYSPQQEGQVSLRFAILDLMGDPVHISDQYDMLLDFTPPEMPELIKLDYTDTLAEIFVSDSLSGVTEISTDRGLTWSAPGSPAYMRGEKHQIVRAGMVKVRDAAGNVSENMEEFTFGKPRYSGYSSGKKSIQHVPETLDYSTVNYNALELSFPEEPVTQLMAGGEALALTLENEDGELAAFTAELTAWQSGEEEEPASGNALILTAQEAQGMNIWRFGGDVYRLLYNSGVEYLVFESGGYITALPTAGFTGGTAYARLKASGVSTRKFAYTLCQDEPLRETVLSVAVEGETYLLEEDTSLPMYRYDVLIGARSLMEKPYNSYLKTSDEAM